MSTAHTTPAERRRRRMKLYVVEYWTDPKKEFDFVLDGLYVVRANNREECAQLLFTAQEAHMTQPGEDTTELMSRIRASVAKADNFTVWGLYTQHATMIGCNYHI